MSAPEPLPAPDSHSESGVTVNSVTKKAVKSTAWTYLSYILSKGANLATTIILARLLTTAQFGIVGFALTAMSFLDAVRDLGLELALIQRRDDIEDAAHTAFWMNIASNLIIWLVACIASPFVAAFFNEPLIVIILPVLSFSFVISSFGGTHDALIKREMKFGLRFVPSLGESLLKSVVAIELALMGLGVWALVLGQLVGRFTFAVLAWRVLPWRPKLRFKLPIARQLFSYGYKASIDSFLSALQANIDYVFIGRLLGDAALGVYTVAYRMPEILIINFSIVIAQVLFPAYAMLQNDHDQLRRGVLTALRYVSLVTIPAGVGLALIAPLFTQTLFGAEWAAAGPVMAILSLYGAVLAVSWNIGDVYKAIGRPDILWKTTLVEFLLLAPTLYILAQDSAFAVAVGHLGVAVLVSLLRLYIASRILGFAFWGALRQFVPALIGSALMGGAVWLVLEALNGWVWQRTLNGMIGIFVAIGVGGVVYLAALWWLEREMFNRVLGMALGLVRRGEAASASAD
jgi:O-antigen/teichoic acid export membrane protein